jgi:hypothetical protein
MKFKNHLYTLVVISSIYFSGSHLTAQELVRPVITGAPFLQIVPDARSGGMGEAGVATLGDNYAQFHNPAKFLFMQESSRGIGLSYIPQFANYANDIFHANASYFQKLNERSALSGSLTYFSYGNVELEEEMGNEIINQGSFVPNEFALDAAYSLKLNENFGMSVAARYIRSSITDDQMNSTVQLKTAQAVAVDISGFYTSAPFTHRDKWTAGFSLKNIGSKLEYSSETGYEYPLPTSLKLGGGYHVAVSAQDYLSFYVETLKYLVPATDEERNMPDDSAIGGMFSSFGDAPGGFSEEMKELIFSIGSEYNFNEKFKLRAGYIAQNREKGMLNHFTFGAGAAWEGLIFDVAYQTPVTENASFNNDSLFKISLSYEFGSIKEEKIALLK